MSDNLKIDRQFGFVNNLFIALAAGALTVLVNLTFNSSFKTLSTTVRYMLMSSAILFFLSLLFGVCLAWIRINHYRIASQVKVATESEKNVKLLAFISSEQKNRKLIRFQGVLLLVGSFAMLLSLVWYFLQ